MEFGNRQNFAVQFELDKNYGGSWLYGKLCYWINSIQVGDYDLGTSLRDVLFQMKWVVNDCGNRNGEILCGLGPHDIFSAIDGLLYEDNEDKYVSEIQLPGTPARFEIKIPVDIFDQWKIYLIDCDNTAKILFKNINDTDIHVAIIAMGEFDSVIKEVYDSLNKLYDKEDDI
jgi:hypothetical protein